MRSKPLHPHALERLRALAGTYARVLLPSTRLHPDTFPAQVATKVVAQNARLPIAPVEQVHQRMVASRRAFPHSHFVQGYVPRGVRYSHGGMLAHG